MTDDELFFERKERLVGKEFDTGFSSYQRLENKVASLRQWTVTINAGFVLYVLSNNKNLLILFAVVFMFMIILLLLELRVRSSMNFDKSNILKLERLFNEKNYQIYKTEIEKYIFRDIRLLELNAKIKLEHYFCSMYKGEVMIWYSMWVVIWTSLIIIKKLSWFQSHLWIPCVLFVIYLAILVMLFWKYFKNDKHKGINSGEKAKAVVLDR